MGLAGCDGVSRNPMIPGRMHLATLDPLPNAFGQPRLFGESENQWFIISFLGNFFKNSLKQPDHPSMKSASCLVTSSPGKVVSMCSRIQSQQHVMSCKATCSSSVICASFCTGCSPFEKCHNPFDWNMNYLLFFYQHPVHTWTLVCTSNPSPSTSLGHSSRPSCRNPGHVLDKALWLNQATHWIQKTVLYFSRLGPNRFKRFQK